MNRDKLKNGVIGLAVVGLLIFLSQFRFFSVIIDIVKKPFRPVQTKIYAGATKANNFINSVFLAKQLRRDVDVLSARIVELAKENIQLKDLQLENKNLRDLLAFKESSRTQKMIIAPVVGKITLEPTILLLDKGQADGLDIGQAVITDKGILIGRLIKVDFFTSQAMLLTDSRSEVSASFSRGTRQSGVVIGEKGLSLKMQLIPISENVKKRDLIVSSGLEDQIPYGLIIGEVEDINKKPNELFQEAIVRTPISQDSVTLVGIIKK